MGALQQVVAVVLAGTTLMLLGSTGHRVVTLPRSQRHINEWGRCSFGSGSKAVADEGATELLEHVFEQLVQQSVDQRPVFFGN